LQSPPLWARLVSPSLSPHRKVEDLQFRVEEESITKGDLEVTVPAPPRLTRRPRPALTVASGHDV
jgi:hypothetical protein